MSAKRVPVTISAAVRFGIVPEHWAGFAKAASRMGYLIMLREGKSASVPWIRKGFPAKPLQFKTKVHPGLGLLVVETPEERSHFIAHPTCDLVPVFDGGEPVSVSQVADMNRFEQFLLDTIRSHQDAQLGAGTDYDRPLLPALVVQRSNGLPYTSDYDIAAVIDTRAPNYEVTFMSQGSLADSKSRTNCMIDALARQLNQEFRTDRIQHGTEAQYSGQAANKDHEGLILFRPDGRMEFMHGGNAVESWQLIRDLMTEYHPSMADSFRN